MRQDALNEANGPDPAGGERRVGPLLERWPDSLTLADQAIERGKAYAAAGVARTKAADSDAYAAAARSRHDG